MIKSIFRRLPRKLRLFLRQARTSLKTSLGIIYLGKARYCPVCEKSSRVFLPYGRVPRPDAMCPRCLALERHRVLWLFLKTKTDLFDGKAKKMLHVAPEACFRRHFQRRLGESYLTADLFNEDVMIKMDITEIQFPDQSFDVIYCSHVLEHVDDDRKAMREFNRVLKNDGWAILLVPITAKETFEDASITDPQERLKVFGQEDHVRRYGPDYVDRLREAGFQVTVTKQGDIVSSDEMGRLGLSKSGTEIYFCTK